VSANVVYGRDDRSRGFGFVEFDSNESQLYALKEMDGRTVSDEKGDRIIQVKEAFENQNNNNNE